MRAGFFSSKFEYAGFQKNMIRTADFFHTDGILFTESST